MKKKQTFIHVPRSGLEADTQVCEDWSLCTSRAHFWKKKCVECSVQYFGRSLWTWGTLELTMFISFKIMPRVKFHKTNLEMLFSVPVRVFNSFTLSLFTFFFSSIQMWKLLALLWFSAEGIWKILSIYPCRLLWETPAPRKCASAFRGVLHLQRHSLTWRLLKCFSFCLHMGRFYFQ